MNAVGALAVVAGLLTLFSLMRLARRQDVWPQDEIRHGMFSGFRRQRDLASTTLATLIATICTLLMLGEATGWPGFGVVAWLSGAYLCVGGTTAYALVVAAGESTAKDMDPCWRALCLALCWPWIDKPGDDAAAEPFA